MILHNQQLNALDDNQVLQQSAAFHGENCTHEMCLQIVQFTCKSSPCSMVSNVIQFCHAFYTEYICITSCKGTTQHLGCANTAKAQSISYFQSWNNFSAKIFCLTSFHDHFCAIFPKFVQLSYKFHPCYETNVNYDQSMRCSQLMSSKNS